MIKNTPQIEQDFYDLVAPFFQDRVDGDIYMSGTRPLDSSTEDVVICEPGADGSQFQNGRVRILIFVPDIDNNSGHLVPDKGRIQEIASLDTALLKWMQANTTDYILDFFNATTTGQYPGAKEHFVAMHFEFETETF